MSHKTRQHTAVMTAEIAQCAQRGDKSTRDFPCLVPVHGHFLVLCHWPDARLEGYHARGSASLGCECSKRHMAFQATLSRALHTAVNPTQRSLYAAVRRRGHCSGVHHTAVDPTQRSSYTAVRSITAESRHRGFRSQEQAGTKLRSRVLHTQRSIVAPQFLEPGTDRNTVTKQSPLRVSEKVAQPLNLTSK